MKNTVFSPAPLARLSGWFDRLADEKTIARLERATIGFALAGFSLHLLLIFLTRQGVFGPETLLHLPTSYLKAIYTPFSLILFYEVLTLVLILPKSIATFIGKQYEIVTLITIRSFFHDIADYNLDEPEIYTFSFLGEVGLDLIGALLLFFLTTLYYRIFTKTRKSQADPSSKRTRIIHVKKTAALVLSLLLLVLSVVSLWGWLGDVYQAGLDHRAFPNPNGVFYTDFFTVMIFVDVFLLILSFVYSGTYDLIFRNAGFVVSTILVRIALAAEKPFSIYFALTAVGFGVLLMALFVFYNQQTQHVPDSED